MNTPELSPRQLESEIGVRLDRLPLSRFHITVLIVASLSLLFDTLDTVLTGFVLAVVRPEWGFDVVWIGIISAVGLAGYWLGALTGGFAADKYGRRAVVLYTLIAYSFISVSRGFTDGVTSFMILNFLTWIFVGVESSVIPPYLAELWPARLRAKFSGWMMMFFALGIGASPLWAAAIIPNFGWEWAFFLTAPFALLFGFMRRYLPESPRWLARNGQNALALQTVSEIEKKVNAHPLGRPSSTQDSKASAPEQKTDADGTESNLRARDLLSAQYLPRSIMLWIAWFAQYGVTYAFLTFVPTLLVLSGVTVTKSLTYSVVIYIAYVPGYALGGYLADLLDRKWLIVLAFSGTAIFGTSFAFMNDPTAIMVFGGLTTFFSGLGATGVYTYTPELYPTEIRATAMGIASAWGRIGSISLLLIFGIFAASQSRLFLFVIADGFLIAGILAVAIFGPKTRMQSLDVTAAVSSTESAIVGPRQSSV